MKRLFIIISFVIIALYLHAQNNLLLETPIAQAILLALTHYWLRPPTVSTRTLFKQSIKAIIYLTTSNHPIQ